MLTGFYGEFHATVEAGQHIERSTVGSAREIGAHPETGEKITARLGKYGPYVALGDNRGRSQARLCQPAQRPVHREHHPGAGPGAV